ncbi:MAG TPA: aminopeptidase P N-terminal domain-containing protein [Parafilimonas sp.]|nr:aminopeptidase P N-terminal domain-containing protein [Parafilimonas sp.]
MRKFVLFFISLFTAVSLAAQENLPTDYLPASFHAGRRQALRELMPSNSVAVIFANPVHVFSEDVDFSYHPNADLYYFSGYKEPNAVLLIFKDMQTSGDKQYNEVFFIQKRDSARESWTGKRMGIEKARSQLGFDMVFNGADFKTFPVDFSKFDKILIPALPTTAEDFPDDAADLHDLVQTFRDNAGTDKFIDAKDDYFLNAFTTYVKMSNLPRFKQYLQNQVDAKTLDPAHLFVREISVQDILNINDSAALEDIKAQLDGRPVSTSLYNHYVSILRQIKTPEELVLLRKSVAISSIAHAEVMKAIQPGMSEKDLQAIFEFVHLKYGAEEEGYPPIVGAGNNGCTLHYEENTKMNYGTDMVLMDVGSMYHGYSADVTRTVPSTGKYTTEQKAIYDLVYNAQDSVFKLCREGMTFDSTENTARKVLAEGLVKLGIIKSKEEVSRYYPHGCSHFIGLDVHDKGIYQTLLANMAITVEPGIYIPVNSPCDKKWWGIAVRIEDDILITKNGYELLSKDAPRKSEDVEKMAAKKSVLNDYVLPKL